MEGKINIFNRKHKSDFSGKYVYSESFLSERRKKMDQGIKKESIPCFSLKYSRKIRFLIYEN
jgi:hypothetical protein